MIHEPGPRIELGTLVLADDWSATEVTLLCKVKDGLHCLESDFVK